MFESLFFKHLQKLQKPLRAFETFDFPICFLFALKTFNFLKLQNFHRNLSCLENSKRIKILHQTFQTQSLSLRGHRKYLFIIRTHIMAPADYPLGLHLTMTITYDLRGCETEGEILMRR